MGAVEAALDELGDASARVSRERRRWESVSTESLSLTTNYAIGNAARQLRAKATSGDVRAKATNPSTIAPLNSRQTRLGLGIRQRALLRSEQALACHAGALHDLRVLLYDVGSEWLELGRWVGGPPLASMPWDAQPCKAQQVELLRACARVVAQMEATAAVLREHGPYALYAEPFPIGARGVPDKEVAIRPTRGALLAATRDVLGSVRTIRHGRQMRPPRALRSPGVLQRHSLVWLATLVLAVLTYYRWLPILLPMRDEAMRAAAKAATDLARFWKTHVTEPFKGIATELFHEVKPTIDPAQVVETRESLRRMLQDFVRDTHSEGSSASGGVPLQEALARASEGNMESVTSAYEEQVRAPVSNLINGQLLRSLLLLVQQLRLLMEEEVEAVDSLLRRNDFNLQVMATVPALAFMWLILMLLRSSWRRLRGSESARRDPIEAIQAEVIAIDALLTRGESTRGDHQLGYESRHESREPRPPAFQRCALTRFEASPMSLAEVGELVFRVQRLRAAGSQWLRGLVKKELMHDAQVLLDSGRLSARQRSSVARTLLRRLDNLVTLRDHW